MKRRYYPLICISGPDGVGKTTQAMMLIEYFKKKEHRTKYVWLRFNHFFSLALLGYMKMIGLSSVIYSSDGKKIGFHDLKNNKHLARIYEMSLLIDMFLASVIKIYLPMIAKRIVICDRYVIDTIVDIMINTSDHNFHKSSIGRLLYALAPKNCINIIIISKFDILRNRKTDINIDNQFTLRIHLYKKLANDNQITIFNVEEKSIREIQELLIKKLKIECGEFD